MTPLLQALIGAVILSGLSAIRPLPISAKEADASAAGKTSPDRQVAAPDLFVQIALIQAEIELLRFEMGKPNAKSLNIKVTNAATRGVFFQALTLLEKSERLAYEQTRESLESEKSVQTTPKTDDVIEVLSLAMTRIRHVKEKLKVTDVAESPNRDPSKTTDDVFLAIIAANRQLNMMLDREFSPSDVYQQVTVAIGYTARLLAQFPDSTRIPDPPAFERGKRPVDVYRRLAGCYARVRKIAEQSGLKSPELEVAEHLVEAVEPSDVYDMVSLIISELAFIHSKVPGASTPRPAYFPGRKFPSHVFQRVGILETQLIDLGEQIQSDSEWLSGGHKTE